MAVTLIDMLVEEHRGFKSMLSVMEAVAVRLRGHGDVPRAMLADVIDFFELFTNGHHEREEHVLFPALAAHGISEEQTVVKALLAQHDAGRVYCRKMRGDLARLSGGDESAAEDLATHALDYCELIREHIRIEDEYFYRLATGLLTEGEQQAIMAQFRGRGPEGRHPQQDRFLRMLAEYPRVVASWA